MLSMAAQTVIISTISRFDLRTTISAATGNGADEAFLFKHRQGFAHRRPAHAEILGELPLIQPDFQPVAVDVHFGDGPFDRVARLLAQADAQVDRFGRWFLQSSLPAIWYASFIWFLVCHE